MRGDGKQNSKGQCVSVFPRDVDGSPLLFLLCGDAYCLCHFVSAYQDGYLKISIVNWRHVPSIRWIRENVPEYYFCMEVEAFGALAVLHFNLAARQLFSFMKISIRSEYQHDPFTLIVNFAGLLSSRSLLLAILPLKQRLRH